MVTTTVKSVRLILAISLSLSLFLSGCVAPSTKTLDTSAALQPEDGIVYVVPFDPILVPPSFSRELFDRLADLLNADRDGARIKWFFITDRPLGEVDPAWLQKQVYITGEIWSYRENSGCCQTEVSAHARAYIYPSGATQPAFAIHVPATVFFDHDQSDIDEERKKLAQQLARELASRIIATLASRS